ncbi:MAG: hypothetical protein GY795_24515 [Desulfobacterales bacterium]|nr:hypothetical protein [Desulfobacterales bacterium]
MGDLGPIPGVASTKRAEALVAGDPLAVFHADGSRETRFIVGIDRTDDGSVAVTRDDGVIHVYPRGSRATMASYPLGAEEADGG